MAITVADIVARIRSEGADKVVSDMGKAEVATENLGSKTGQVSAKMVTYGKRMTAGITLPVAALGVKMVMSASDQSEALSALNAVYGKNSAASKQLTDAAFNAADTVGLSATQYAQAVTQLGVFGKQAGYTGSDLTNFSQKMVGAAADLSSFYNVPVDEALAAIQSGLMGEAEPLRKFGIFLTEDAVKAKAMEMGLVGANGELSEQAKIAARNAIIMENMGDAQGDFARTSDGLANKQRILKAELANLSAEMGQALLPIALKLVGGFSKFITKIGQFSPRLKRIILIVGAVAAAIGPLLVVIGMIAPAVTTAVPIIVAALGLLFSPIGLIVAALVGLGIAYKTNFLGFGDAVRFVAGKLRDFVGGLVQFGKAFAAAFSSGAKVRDLVKQFPGPIQAAMRGLLLMADAIGDVVRAFKKGGLGAALDVLPKALSQVLQGIKILISEGINALKNAISSVDWGAVLSGAIDLAGKAILAMGDLAGKVAGWVVDAAQDVPWTDLIKGAAGLAEQALVKAGELGAKAAVWFGNAVREVNWSRLIDGALDLSGKALEKAGDLAVKIGLWFTNAVANVNWPRLIDGAADLAAKAIAKAGDLAGQVLSWVAGAIPGVDKWLEIIGGAAELATKAVAKFGELAGKVVAWVRGAVPGIDAWLDIIAGAADLAQKAIEKMGDLAGAVKSWVSAVLTVVNWSSIFAPITSAFDAIGAAVTGVKTVIDTVSGGITTGIQTIRDAFGLLDDVVDAVLGPIQSAIDGVEKGLGLVAQGLSMIPGFGGKDKGGSDTGGINITDAILAKSAITEARETITRERVNIQAEFSYLQSSIDSTKTKFQELPPEVATQMVQAYTNVQTNVIGMQRRLNELKDSLGQTGTDGGKAFGDNLATEIGLAVRTHDAFMDSIERRAGLNVSSLGAFGTAAGAGFKNNLSTQLGLAVATTKAMMSAIESAVGALAGSVSGDAYAVGSAIGQGINNGIAAWIQAIINTARNAVRSAINAARFEAVINSPSKPMLEVGSSMGEGAYLGLDKWVDPIAAKAAELARTGIDGFGATLTNNRISSGGYNAGGPVPTGGASSGGHTFVYMSRDDIRDLFDSADAVRVLTNPDEFRAAWGS